MDSLQKRMMKRNTSRGKTFDDENEKEELFLRVVLVLTLVINDRVTPRIQ